MVRLLSIKLQSFGEVEQCRKTCSTAKSLINQESMIRQKKNCKLKKGRESKCLSGEQQKILNQSMSEEDFWTYNFKKELEKLASEIISVTFVCNCCACYLMHGKQYSSRNNCGQKFHDTS